MKEQIEENKNQLLKEVNDLKAKLSEMKEKVTLNTMKNFSPFEREKIENFKALLII